MLGVKFQAFFPPTQTKLRGLKFQTNLRPIIDHYGRDLV